MQNICSRLVFIPNQLFPCPLGQQAGLQPLERGSSSWPLAPGEMPWIYGGVWPTRGFHRLSEIQVSVGNQCVPPLELDQSFGGQAGLVGPGFHLAELVGPAHHQLTPFSLQPSTEGATEIPSPLCCPPFPPISFPFLFPFSEAQAMCTAAGVGVGCLDQSLPHDSWALRGGEPCAHTAGQQCPSTYHPPRLQPSVSRVGPNSSMSLHRLQCACQHNTCGGSCDRCCPGFNQQPWKPATTDSANECQCEYTVRLCTVRLAPPAPKGPRDTEDMLTIGPNPTACNCHGHGHDCYYDPEVDRRNASQNQDNVYQGGGVCLDCQVG